MTDDEIRGVLTEDMKMGKAFADPEIQQLFRVVMAWRGHNYVLGSPSLNHAVENLADRLHDKYDLDFEQYT